MSKFLLTLFAFLAVSASVSAQKLSLATNFSSASYKLTPGKVDSVYSKPLLAGSKPTPIVYTNTKPGAAKDKTETELERDVIEETAKLRLQGRQDAKLYYKPRTVFWGTMGTTILYPAAGLVTGAVVAVVPPSINDEINPNAHLMKEPAYEEAFKKQAHRKRFGNAVAGFSAGVVVLGVVYKVIAGGL